MNLRSLNRWFSIVCAALAVAVLVRCTRDLLAHGEFQTIFRLTPDRDAWVVGLMACALFFPPFVALVMVAMSWARATLERQLFIRYFALTGAVLHGAAAWLWVEAPTVLLVVSALAFVAMAFTTTPPKNSPA